MLKRICGSAVVLFLAMSPSPAVYASQLLLPHLGGRDGGMSGAVVATPIDGPSILLFNPAGAARIQGTQASFGFETGNVSGRYINPATGYDQKSSESPFAPTLWFGTDALGEWHVGVGLYGAVGSTFNFAASPANGVPSRLLGENGILQVGFVAARELVPGLEVGVQVAPSFGQLKGKMPTPLGEVSFDMDGFGITGSVGALYSLDSRTTIGLAYRAPGVVFMSGDGKVGGASESVEMDLRTPQTIFLGLARQYSDKLLLSVQSAWTYYPDFEKGKYEFKNNPALNQPFIADARPTVRWTAGLEYAVREWAWLRAGVSYEPWMIEASALRPTLYDSSDFMLMLGLGVNLKPWQVDMQLGLGKGEDRVVTEADQTFFPGRYQLESGIGGGITATYSFGA